MKDSEEDGVRNESPGQLFLQSARRFYMGVKNSLDRIGSKWNELSLLAKILAWIPAQAILFKLQPELWKALRIITDLLMSTVGFIIVETSTLEFRLQLLLVIVGIFTLQTTILSLRLIRLEYRINELADQLGDFDEVPDSIMTDGGDSTDLSKKVGDESQSTGTGAIGGALTGGAFGASIGGPAGALGGALLGGIIGRELEKKSAETRTEQPSYPESDQHFEFAHVKTEFDEELSVGSHIQFTLTLTENLIDEIKVRSGPRLGADWSDSIQKKTFVIVSQLINDAIYQLPGEIVLLSQDLEYIEPIMIGDQFTVRVEVVELFDDEKRRLNTTVTKGDKTIIDGQAVALVEEDDVNTE